MTDKIPMRRVVLLAVELLLIAVALAYVVVKAVALTRPRFPELREGYYLFVDEGVGKSIDTWNVVFAKGAEAPHDAFAMFRMHPNGFFGAVAWRDNRGTFIKKLWEDVPEFGWDKTTVLDTRSGEPLSQEAFERLMGMQADLDILPRRLYPLQKGSKFFYVKRAGRVRKYCCSILHLDRTAPYDGERFDRFRKTLDPFSPPWSDWGEL